MSKPKGSRDIAPMIRGAFKRAVLQLEEDGKPLSTLIYEKLQEDVLSTLKAISSFVPKELEVRRMPTCLEDMNDDELEQLSSLAASILDVSEEGEEDQD